MESIVHHWIQQGKVEVREEATRLANIKMQKKKLLWQKK
ncbi:hypothetical protein RBEMOGI_1574 [Rickettsia bellii str. RML Mogi]|uniref:Uncharacterized protein n=1 Tax=Rickettsia bellii str. RML Mogi TaxID=1359194 RepID=A0A0F3QK01_RICBE|nr:hypothetical protein A1I_01560 [Rickettsia bellii OSU 85-389]KJV92935.1 hypothetical protein RBEMOGI_1574 [Rickettsia bellii str. RML Mogi]